MATSSAPFTWYFKAPSHIDFQELLTNDIKVALVTSGYTPNFTTHEFFDVSITNELTTADGYTAGGQALSSKTVTQTGTPGEWVFSSANPVWTIVTANLTAHGLVLYNNTPSTNKPLLGFAYLNYNGGTPLDVTTNVGANFMLLIPSGGWFKTALTNGV